MRAGGSSYYVFHLDIRHLESREPKPLLPPRSHHKKIPQGRVVAYHNTNESIDRSIYFPVILSCRRLVPRRLHQQLFSQTIMSWVSSSGKAPLVQSMPSIAVKAGEPQNGPVKWHRNKRRVRRKPPWIDCTLRVSCIRSSCRICLVR